MNQEYTAKCFVDFSIQFALFLRNQYEKKTSLKVDSMTFRVLAALQFCPAQPLTMSALAKEVAITKQQLTQVVNSLEDKGLVKRSHSRENRRKIYVSLSPSGCRLLAETKEQMAQDAMAMLACYSESEQEELGNCLRRLTELLSLPESSESAPEKPDFPPGAKKI